MFYLLVAVIPIILVLRLLSQRGRDTYLPVQPGNEIKIPYSDLIEGYSVMYGVPAGLIKATIKVESDFQPTAFGRDKEYGLMQIMCSTARDMGFIGDCNGLFDPMTNIKHGVKYLAYQYERYGNWTDAISAYNAGHRTSINAVYVQNVQTWWRAYS